MCMLSLVVEDITKNLPINCSHLGGLFDCFYFSFVGCVELSVGGDIG